MSSTHDLEVPIVSPVAGEVIAIADVPDPVFSSKAVGDGFGVEPTDGTVVSPVDGTVTMVAKTKHAIAFETDSGLEVLVHLGIDTVELDGAPFDLNVEVGHRVAAGQVMGAMDRSRVVEAGKKATVIVAFTNTDTHLSKLEVATGSVSVGEEAAVAALKESAVSVSVSEGASTADAPVTGAEGASHASPGDTGDSGLTGYDATARDIIARIGGPDNVRSVVHCITRLRFYLKDDSLADDAAVAGTEGVIDVAKAGGQYQVVIGPGVNDVYDAVVKQLPQGSAGQEAEAEAAEPVERPTTALGWVKHGFSSLIGVITGSMIPVIGMLAASGILKGLLAILTQSGVVEDSSNTYKIIDAMSSSMFYFLPIIIGFTAARRLGADPIVVAVIGGVLCYPSLVNMSNPDYLVKTTPNPEVGSLKDLDQPYNIVAQLGGTVFNGDFFGIPISLPEGNAYAYSIFPVIVAAWLASKIEPWLKKRIPAVVRSIFVPLAEIFIVSALVLVVFGPIVMLISGGIANGINAIIDFKYVLAGFVIGGLYQCLVIFGLHWAVIPLISAQIAVGESSRINAIVSATMIAQGAGALAIWVKTRNSKIKGLAGPATISAMCGVTEPAMYGLNLKYGRVFVTASIGGAVGGLITGLLEVEMWGFTGAFVGFPSFINKTGADSSFVGFWIASFAALIVGFLCTYFFGFKESDFDTERTVKKVRLGRREPVAQ